MDVCRTGAGLIFGDFQVELNFMYKMYCRSVLSLLHDDGLASREQDIGQ